MPSFLLHFVLLDAAPLEVANLRDILLKLDFTDKLVSSHKLVYELPASVYHCSTYASKDEVLDCVKRVALRQRRKSQILITEMVGSAWVGLNMLGREPDAIETEPNPGTAVTPEASTRRSRASSQPARK